MAHGEFVWCNLSSFRPEVTKRFYRKLLGWSYIETAQPDGWPYHVAMAGNLDTASIFEMPKTFQDLRMPSFWMPYISVEDLDTACETAVRLGGTVELGPLAWSGNDQIVLIRDPLGAGFTVHRGDGLMPDPREGWPGHRAWCSLVVSNTDEVAPFYGELFDWQISRNGRDFWVRTRGGKLIADLSTVRDEARGHYQFWGVYFAVPSLERAARALTRLGGEVFYEAQSHDGLYLLAKDPDGAAFFLIEPAG